MIVFTENYGGEDNANGLLHTKIWDVYVNKKVNLV